MTLMMMILVLKIMMMNSIEGSFTGSSGGSLIALHLDAFSRLYLNMRLIRTKMMSMMKSVTIINFWMLFYIYIDIFGFQSVFIIQVQFLICLEFTLNFLDCAKYTLAHKSK